MMQSTTTFYTFEKDYAQREGIPSSCTVYEYIKSVSCGDLLTPEDFIDKWTSIRGMEKNKHGKLINDAYRELRTKGYSDYDLAKDIIEGDKIQYKMQAHYDYQRLASGFGWSVAIGLFVYLLGLLIYKLILYIVYGHTRIKKSLSL